MTIINATLTEIANNPFQFMSSDELIAVRNDVANTDLDLDMWRKLYSRALNAENILGSMTAYFEDDQIVDAKEWKFMSSRLADEALLNNGGAAGIVSALQISGFSAEQMVMDEMRAITQDYVAPTLIIPAEPVVEEEELTAAEPVVEDMTLASREVATMPKINPAENSGIMSVLDSDSELAALLGDTTLSDEITGSMATLTAPAVATTTYTDLSTRGTGLNAEGTIAEIGDVDMPTRAYTAAPVITDATLPEDELVADTTPKEKSVSEATEVRFANGVDTKTAINEVVQLNMNQIRYGYQRELQKNPGLSGKIVIKFVIAKDGTVSSATVKSSTMNNAAVESSICGRFMRFKFPPTTGGIIVASYPLTFSPVEGTDFEAVAVN